MGESTINVEAKNIHDVFYSPGSYFHFLFLFSKLKKISERKQTHRLHHSRFTHSKVEPLKGFYFAKNKEDIFLYFVLIPTKIFDDVRYMETLIEEKSLSRKTPISQGKTQRISFKLLFFLFSIVYQFIDEKSMATSRFIELKNNFVLTASW